MPTQLPIDFAFMPFLGTAGTADDDDASLFFMTLDMEDAVIRRKLIAKFIVPYCDTFSEETLASIKIALGYLIHHHEDELLRYGFHRYIPAFDLPQDERNFFIEVWESIFRQSFSFGDDIEVTFTREIVNPEYKNLERSHFINDNQTWTLDNDYGL